MDHPNPSFMGDCIDRAVNVYGVGSLLVQDGDVLARSTGEVSARPDPTAHAEIEVIRAGSRMRESHHLSDCWLYTTHEPCPMCMAASCWAHLDGVVFAARQTDMPDDWGSMFPETTAEEIHQQAAHRPDLIAEFRREDALEIHAAGESP